MNDGTHVVREPGVAGGCLHLFFDVVVAAVCCSWSSPTPTPTPMPVLAYTAYSLSWPRIPRAGTQTLSKILDGCMSAEQQRRSELSRT